MEPIEATAWRCGNCRKVYRSSSAASDCCVREAKARWYHLLGMGLFAAMVGTMLVYGFGEMWLGWDPCPGPDDPFDLYDPDPPCESDESIMPIMGGIFAPMVLVLGLVLFVIKLVANRKAPVGNLEAAPDA